MALVRLPRELLLDIAAFEDITFQDRLSLRLVHPVLAELLASQAIETTRVTLTPEATINASVADILALINHRELSRVRSSVRALKIWIPCSAGNGKAFYSREKETDSWENILQKELANTEDDKIMMNLFLKLRGCLPSLQEVELKAWCGRGGRELTKQVLRALKRLIVPYQTGSLAPALSISLHGFGAEPGLDRNHALLYRIPDTVRALEIRGRSKDTLHLRLEEWLARAVTRCSSLSKLVVAMDVRGRHPFLHAILDNRDKYLRKNSRNLGPVALRDLDVNYKMVIDDDSRPEPPPDLDAKHAARLARLQSLRIHGRSLTGSSQGPEIWDGFLAAGIWLESVRTEWVGEEQPSPFLAYLSAPQVGRTLRVLDLQGFHSDDYDVNDLERMAETFWTRVLPNVSRQLEELTLLPYARAALRDRVTPSLKVLHAWSLSHKTLIQTEQIPFPKLRALTSYAILDEEPYSEILTSGDVGRTYNTVTYNDCDAALTVKDLLTYLGCYCPKLADAKLCIFPGGPLRVSGKGYIDTKKPIIINSEIRRRLARISEEICDPDNTSGYDPMNFGSYHFRPYAELAVSIVESGGGLRTIDTDEYFYSSGRWHKRRQEQPQPRRKIDRRSHEDMFPENLEYAEV